MSIFYTNLPILSDHKQHLSISLHFDFIGFDADMFFGVVSDGISFRHELVLDYIPGNRA